MYSLKPAAAAFEEANNPRPAGTSRPRHIRTPSVVLGGGRGGAPAAAASFDPDNLDLSNGSDGSGGGTQGAAHVISWVGLCTQVESS